MIKQIILFKKHTVERVLPKNYVKEDNFLFVKELKREMPSQSVYFYKNIYINYDEFLWKKFKFLEHSFFRRNFRKKISKINKLKFFLKSLFIKKTDIERGVWAIDRWSNTYFHWFLDVVQKITMLNDNTNILLLPEHFASFDYIVKSSKLLNLKIYFIKKNEIIRCKNFKLIPTEYISGNYYEEILTKIYSKFNSGLLNRLNNLKPSIIYITRKKTKRKVVNENDVCNSVLKKGGQVVVLEDLKWEKQIELIFSAKLIISSHGAGLTNILFSNKSNNLKIIEFRHENSSEQNMYFSMSSALRIDYYYIKCHGLTDDAHLSNITVPVNELEKKLDYLLK